MRARVVVFEAQAEHDIQEVFLATNANVGPNASAARVRRLLAFCNRLDLASERGQTRNDIRPGLRIVGFERSLTIAFAVTEAEVRILRVFQKGADWESTFDDDA
ncbi:MAG: type II toxin-antitoxin system RelE/ParE family toxin [Pseudomonadota bacterium]